MRGSRLLQVVRFALVTAAVATQVAAVDKPPTQDKPWKIAGQLEEACRCAAACPCWFNSKPTHMNCGGGQILFIEQGNYGDVSLNGLAVGTMSQSPDGKGMMESFGDWVFAYYYIDEKASPEQRQALKAIADKVLTPGASKKVEYRYTPIVRTIEGKEHKISLGQYGQFHGHLIEGGLGGSIKIVNPPGADPLHKEYNQGLTTTMTYKDAEQNWNFKDSNYMFATFKLDSEMYEKYAAGLAQKMAEMKKGETK